MDENIASQTAPLAVVASDKIDPVSGLATRWHFLEQLNIVLQEKSAPVALLYLGIERFKAINESLGLKIGDRVLLRIAQRLAYAAPTGTLLSRVSGAHFAVVLTDVRELETSAQVFAELMNRPFAIGGHAVSISINIGVAVTDEKILDADDLLYAATLAFQEARVNVAHHLRVYDPWMRHRAFNRQALEADLLKLVSPPQQALRHALMSEQFEMYYQPQVAFESGRLCGFEALIRWHHPQRGLVYPDEFIALAEEIGVIDQLGTWVLRASCDDAVKWPVPFGGAPLRVGVNVSPFQLRDGAKLLTCVQDVLAQTGLDAERLEIELTESAVAENSGSVLRDLPSLGVGLAMDDFGTGHSSLARLNAYPFDRIKIDRSFVSALSDDAEPATIRAAERMIRAIAALGVGLEMATIVEGIETPYQLEIARRAGCTEMQGFLIHPPMPAAEVTAFIQAYDPNNYFYTELRNVNAV